MRIKSDKNPLAVEQNNYLTKLQIFTWSMYYMIDQKK